LKIFVVLALLFTSFGNLHAQKEEKLFKDSLDGAFDLSKWLIDLNGFIPIISPITEPAVGYGATVAGVYFIPKEKSNNKEFKMPDIVGLAGGYTQNGTWFAGAGYAGFWKDDHVRYRGILGYGDINLKYYGTGDGFLSKNPADFSISSYFFLQQALFRIKNSGFLFGARYIFGKTTVSFFEESKLPEVNPLDFDLVNSAMGFIGEYDNLNNILSPSKGFRSHLSYVQAFEFLGSDRNNSRLNFFTLAYLPINKRWTSGFRIESIIASDNTPFYLLPYVNLRGVPALRYQGELTMLAETEQMVNVYNRWSLVGFAGIGTTAASLENIEFGATAWNVGGGFRYKIARALGLQMGIDVARGPDDWAFYIVFGSAWLK
ncbi:MAG: hypothetical protein DRJ10_17350, partial [Bacteroidetes bacterium]